MNPPILKSASAFFAAGTQIAPSTHDAFKTRPPSKRTIRDNELLVQIRRVQAKNFGVYGAKKLHAQLRREGVMVARCTGQRLMPAEGLRGITREKGPRITLAGDGRTLALTWSNGTSP
ncbi:hypothetical protein Kosp01_22230 [Kocuria sp. NBRC 114282]|uniref:IS3 family transposase n=1 Tax=Kocuria sp. NBRC 114282 TaxID=2994520 RepID=UPI0024A564AC|nr:IS3 family transposase [Kocuria sp. NBRC 114282]GLU87477.1 hypothetical protein Kosp01_22230 [Kocuria sp. NBRC 114282]